MLVHSGTAAAADASLRGLLQEWYSLVAELLLGDAAAADAGGYRDAHRTLWLERAELMDKDSAADTASPPPPSQCTPAEALIGQLTHLCPLLSPTSTAAASASSHAAAAATSAADAVAASPQPWTDRVADALDDVMSAIDAYLDAPAAPLAVSQAALGGQSFSQIEAALTGESCIMAGLLLQRQVRPRSGPCYATVVPPMLVVMDLDGTLLRTSLGSISLRAAHAATADDVATAFVDAPFLVAFCAAVAQRGHELAICSLTEGAADQHRTGLSVADAVLSFLSLLLPPHRTYLTSVDDVVCVPKSLAGPGKLFHLQELQQRRNERDAQQQHRAATATAAAASHDGVAGDVVGAPLTGNASPLSPPSSLPSAVPLLLPKWLSTDVVLIDDDRENCRLAVTQGYHAFLCAETGMCAAWYAANPELQVLLGLPAEAVMPRQHSG